MERNKSERTKWPAAMLILVGIGVVVLVVFGLYRRMGPLPTLTDRDIAGVTTITSDWLEVRVDPALKASSKTPFVILKLEGNYAPEFASQKLRYPDGTLGVPDVELIDEQGNVFALHFLMVQHRDRTGSNELGGAGFGSSDLPTDRSYRL